jgi:hypothetical protein
MNAGLEAPSNVFLLRRAACRFGPPNQYSRAQAAVHAPFRHVHFQLPPAASGRSDTGVLDSSRFHACARSMAPSRPPESRAVELLHRSFCTKQSFAGIAAGKFLPIIQCTGSHVADPVTPGLSQGRRPLPSTLARRVGQRQKRRSWSSMGALLKNPYLAA